MQSSRLLLVVSLFLVVFLVAGGLAVRVGAGESSWHQVVVFGEVLSLVIDNYVDPVDADALLLGAYEGMLGGLDANGAYLTPAEVREWKAGDGDAPADTGISVLKSGRALQVVAVDPQSSAAEAGIQVGDHLRTVDGRAIGDLSLGQAWRLLSGAPGTTVRVDLLHPREGLSRETVELQRALRRAPAQRLEIDGAVAVLRLLDLSRLPLDEVAAELRGLGERGVDTLLVDLRNVVDLRPRDVAGAASLFGPGVRFQLRDRSGRLVESLGGEGEAPAWSGPVAALVNGATAGSAEALARMIQTELDGRVLGEATYGLGAEVKLYELESGSGLLISSAVWETASGGQWNAKGVQPDDVVHGRGRDYAEASADQLRLALELLEQQRATRAETQREAA